MSLRSGRAAHANFWAAFNSGGVEQMLDWIHPDAEWHLYLGSEDVYRGHDGIRRYYRECQHFRDSPGLRTR